MIRRVLGLDQPLVEHPASKTLLYPHQAAMLDAWESETTLALSSKTGSGKTRAAMLPVLHRREYAIAVYPTNELLRDQVRAVEQLATQEGIRSIVYTPENQQNAALADHLLVPLDAKMLDRWQGRMRSRAEALRRLLDRQRPRIVFTNPDILFNILSAQYHLDALEPLRIYETLIFDEFHLYNGVEFAHALMMVRLARGLGCFRRVVLLSATPHPDVQIAVDRVLSPFQVSSSQHAATGPRRTAVHDVTVFPVLAAEDPIDQIASKIMASRTDIVSLRAKHPEDSYIPAVAIVNSVLDAIRLEDEIVRRGFDRASIAVIRGLSNRAVRSRAGKLIALGTSAIEVGVDFDCDLLFFEALEAASFLQRFGRAGRHRTGEAFMFIPSNAIKAMSSAPDVLDRSAFERLVYDCYPLSDARPWFATTELGLLTAAAMPERLYQTVERDWNASQNLLSRFRDRLDAIFAEYGSALGCGEVLDRVKAKVDGYRRAIPNMRWYGAYLRLNRFRTSIPSVEVHDWREHARRGEWELGSYEVDIGTLLKRGRNIRRHPTAGLLINGIGSSRRVHAGESAAHLPQGVPLLTAERPIRLLQDGVDTPVSDYLSESNHVYTAVPRAEVEGLLDWRLTCFEAGQNLIAFDGSALLLIETWRRSRSARA